MPSADMAEGDAPVEEVPLALVLGTERLGRPYTDEERRQVQKALLKAGFHEARRAGLFFGLKLSRNAAMGEDLAQRAFERLVRLGWNPADVPLKERVVRLVWSEWTNELSERTKTRKAEAKYAHDMAVSEGDNAKSPEDYAARLEEERAEEAAGQEQLDKLRAALVKAKDNVNLAWLQHTLEGKTDLGEMALLSGYTVEQFAAARKRRKRIVLRLAAEARGVSYPEEEKPK